MQNQDQCKHQDLDQITTFPDECGNLARCRDCGEFVVRYVKVVRRVTPMEAQLAGLIVELKVELGEMEGVR